MAFSRATAPTRVLPPAFPSSPSARLELAEDLYTGFCWRREADTWTRKRVLYRKGQTAPVALYGSEAPEEVLFRLVTSRAVGKDGLATSAPDRRSAGSNEVLTALQTPVPDSGLSVEQAFHALLDHGILTWSSGDELSMPAPFASAAPRRDTRVKVVRQFSDLTLLWHTARFSDIPATVPLNDDPVLAVPAWIGDAYERLDGRRSLDRVLREVQAVYGASRVTPDRLLSVVARLGELGFLTPESRASLDGAPRTWSQSEWDFDVSLVQKSYINTDLPMFVLMELTARCTRACPFCYKVTHGHEKDMPAEGYLRDVVQKVIDSGIPYVTLLGGEPLLRRDLLFECVRRLKEANVFAKLITNGDLLDASAAQALSDLGLNKIELSLDGFTPETGDRFRGNGSVRSVEQALRNLEGTQISDIGFSITVSSANYGDIVGNLSGFLERYPHANKVYFSRYFEAHQVGPIEGMKELTPAQIRYLSEKIEAEWKPRFRDRPGFDMAVLDAGMCSCGRSLAVLTCEGVIKPCPFTHVGNDSLVERETFRRLWHDSFNPLRMEDKATCWARKVRDRMKLSLPMAPAGPAQPEQPTPLASDPPETAVPDARTVVFVSPEAWPVSKGGGMASAVTGRAASLARAGYTVYVITPLYTSTAIPTGDGARERAFTKDAAVARARLTYTGEVIEARTLAGQTAVAALAQGTVDGVHYLALDSPVFAEALYGYARTGNVTDAETSDLMTLAGSSFVLSMGALEAMRALDIHPSVVIGNDWMCAPLASALAGERAIRQDSLHPRFVAWVHNNGEDYQFRVDGSPVDTLETAPIPPQQWPDYADPGEPGKVNFQSALLRAADYVVAVSPEQKAAYIAHDGVGGGEGLRVLFQQKEADGRLFGIRNGVDVEAWQRTHFGQTAFDACEAGVLPSFLQAAGGARQKARCSLALEHPEFWPETGGQSDQLTPDSFVVTLMSRITAQKGVHLIDAFVRRILGSGHYPEVRFVFAGDGDDELVRRLRRLRRDFPGVVGYLDQFVAEDDPLETYQKVYLAGDLFIAFSLWEPGGLSVMEALARGVPCLVTDRQGHKGTVRSIGPEHRPNGARFQVVDGNTDATINNAVAAFNTLFQTWRQRRQNGEWDGLVLNAFLSDNRWEASLPEVEHLLRSARST